MCDWPLGSGPRYMICFTRFCTCASQNTHGHARIARRTRAILAWPCVKRVRFSHGRVCFCSRNVQKRATKSDISATAYWPLGILVLLLHIITYYCIFLHTWGIQLDFKAGALECLVQVGKDMELDAVGSKFEPCPYSRKRLHAGGAHVVWPGMLFSNSRGD